MSETQEARVREWTIIELMSGTRGWSGPRIPQEVRVPVLSKEDAGAVLREALRQLEGAEAEADDAQGQAKAKQRSSEDDKADEAAATRYFASGESDAYGTAVLVLREAASSLGISLPTPGDAG